MGHAFYYAAVLYYWRGEHDTARARAAEVVALSDGPGIFTSFTVGSKLVTFLVGGAGPGLAELSEELVRLHTGRVFARRVPFASPMLSACPSACAKAATSRVGLL